MHIFDFDVVGEWIRLARRWTGFSRPFYQSIREKERELAVKIAQNSVSQAAILLNTVKLDFSRYHEGDFERQFEPVNNQIQQIWKSALAKEVVESFRREGGIDELFNDEGLQAKRDLLFSSDQNFHNPLIYEELRRLGQEALANDVIQRNFLDLIRRMLFSVSGHDRRGTYSAAGSLIRNSDFTYIVWNAAVCRRIHPRELGSLLEYRMTYTRVSGKADDFPIPTWVGEVEPELLQAFTQPLSNVEIQADTTTLTEEETATNSGHQPSR